MIVFDRVNSTQWCQEITTLRELPSLLLGNKLQIQFMWNTHMPHETFTARCPRNHLHPCAQNPAPGHSAVIGLTANATKRYGTRNFLIKHRRSACEVGASFFTDHAPPSPAPLAGLLLAKISGPQKQHAHPSYQHGPTSTVPPRSLASPRGVRHGAR